MLIALDTNILLYSEGVNGPEKQARIKQVLGQAKKRADFQISTQVLAELFHALSRKFNRERPEAQRCIVDWQGAATSHALGIDAFNNALGLATAHQFQMFDAMIMLAAVEGGCSMLLSEDMQHGFSWRGVTIVNPFTEPFHPVFRAIMMAD